MELNPNHPVTRAAHDQWHKIAALIMRKLGQTAVEITAEDVTSFPLETDIVCDARGGRLVLRLVDRATAMRMAEEAGGTPSQN